MSWVVHLSDLHLLSNPQEQDTIFRSLVAALRAERGRRGSRPDLICFTGDIFDSASLPIDAAIGAFSDLLDQIHDGDPIPTVIVPGNHDRRRNGLWLPFSEQLFDALRDAMCGRAWVLGGERPFLSEVVPHEIHKLPLWLVAYDSNHLPSGFIGAGGALRQEDLLRAAAIINGHEPDWPVLFLLHHHLIPTPLTDLGPIETHGAPSPVRWLVERGLPQILANADREEIFMTALGAGTALSTLSSMGRAVLVLHGHKHYATSRLVAGTTEAQGDVLIVSAGSAGTAQTIWEPAAHRDTARLWPSFNVLELAQNRWEVQQVAFGWREVSDDVARRPMVTVQRNGKRWVPEHVEAPDAVEPGPRLTENTSRIELLPSRRFGRRRWDCEVSRSVRFGEHHASMQYSETVEAPRGSRLVLGAGAMRTDAGPVHLDTVRPASYTIEGAVARTRTEELKLTGRHARPYGRLGLLNRYQCEKATLTVSGLGISVETAFGSVTDLGTGLERNIPVVADGPSDRVTVTLRDCPPRTLLRIYWLLDDAEEPKVSSTRAMHSHTPEAYDESPTRRHPTRHTMTSRAS